MNFHFLNSYDKRNIQKISRIPVPLLNRLERGEAVRLSPSTKKRIRQAVSKINMGELKQSFPDLPSPDLQKISRYTPERFFKAVQVLSQDKNIPEAVEASELKAEEFAKYSFLRSRGIRHDESFTMLSDSWDSIKELGDKTLHYAKILAKGNGVKLEYILKGMAKSKDKTAHDWEHYVSLRKRQKWIPIRKDGKGNYIHDTDENRNREYNERLRSATWRKDMGL